MPANEIVIDTGLRSKVSQGTFLSLLTFEEQEDVFINAATSTQLQVVMSMLKGSPVVDLRDPRVEFGLGVMVAYQCLAYNRIAEIISYQE